MAWPVRLVSILLLLVSTPTGATVLGDGDISERGTPRELSPIGVVTGGQGVGYATGFLISDCEVLTAKHAVGRVPSALGRRLRFAQAVRGGRRSSGTVIAQGEFDLASGSGDAELEGDWLLLRLDRCIGRELGHATLSATTFYRSAHWALGSPIIASAGFPIGRPWRDGITRDPRCRIRAWRLRQLFHDCVGGPGSSGSPLFVIGHGGALTVFAMQVAGPTPAAIRPGFLGNASTAIAVDGIMPQVAPLLTNAVKAAFRQPGRSRQSR